MSAKNPLAGFIEAAKRGDMKAFRAAADFLRKRGQAGDTRDSTSDEERAYYIEVAQHEIAVRHAEARQVRRMLQLGIKVADHHTETGRVSVKLLQRMLANHGLPVNVSRFAGTWARMRNDIVVDELTDATPRKTGWIHVRTIKPYPHVLRCPTDGVDEDRTAQALVDLLHPLYPRARFIVNFANPWISEAGWRGFCELDMV
jgi:hypothetical protein